MCKLRIHFPIKLPNGCTPASSRIQHLAYHIFRVAFPRLLKMIYTVRNHVKCLWLFMLTLWLNQSPLFAQDVGILRGEIRDQASGEPIETASVSVKNTGMVVWSDKHGAFTIVGIPVASYTVEIEATGYANLVVDEVEISRDLSTDLRITLDASLTGDVSVIQFEQVTASSQLFRDGNSVSLRSLSSLPYRSLEEVAKVQAGVVSFDGQPGLYIHGNRPIDVQHTLDGFSLGGDMHNNIPFHALESLSMQTGFMSAAEGDVLGGMINLSLRSNAQKWFGTLEGFTSESLDAYGHNFITGAAGGPLAGGRLNVLVAGEYIDQFDSAPSALGQLRLTPAAMDDLYAFPTAFQTLDDAGNRMLLPIPATLEDGAFLNVDNAGIPLVTNGLLTFSDGSTVDAQGVDPATILLDPVQRAEYLPADAYEQKKALVGQRNENLSLLGNLSVDVLPTTTLSVGGLLNQQKRDFGGEGFERRVLFAPEMIQQIDQEEYYLFGALKQRVSATMLLHIQGSYRNFEQQIFDPRLGKELDDLFFYGDIDHPAFSLLSSIKRRSSEDEIRTVDNGTPNDPTDDISISVRVPYYRSRYFDVAGPANNDQEILSLVQIPGGRYNTYQQRKEERLRFSGYLTSRIGLHQLSIGAAYEQHTNRFWFIDAPLLAGFFADGFTERLDPGNPAFDNDGYSSYESLPLPILDIAVGPYYGFDLRGQHEVDSEDFDGFISQDLDKPLQDYNLAPYQPELLTWYVRDQIEWGNLSIDAGVRFQRFDNNSRTLIDPFTRRPACRVRNLGATANGVDCGDGLVPTNIGEDFVVFYSGDNIVGFRDTDGVYYDSAGQLSTPGNVRLNGQVRLTSNLISEEMFEAYRPDFSILPRINARFRLSNNTSMFVNYGSFAQSPRQEAFATLADYETTGALANSGLTAERQVKVEFGFQRSWTSWLATRLTAFYYSGYDYIVTTSFVASPSVYSGSINRDRLTSKGLLLDVSYKQKSVQADLNYMFSFADGPVGSSLDGVTVIINPDVSALVDIPQFFDQRHRANLALQYETPVSSGPKVWGTYPLGGFHLMAVIQAGSGFPYTSVVDAINLMSVRAGTAAPTSDFNELRMPAYARVDVQIGKRFVYTNRASAVLFLQIQNLFDLTNVNKVWPFTGQVDDNGFLSTPSGEQRLEDVSGNLQTVYQHRSRIPEWAGIPRLIRLGVRFEF